APPSPSVATTTTTLPSSSGSAPPITNANPPAIVSFGVESKNCPAGATSTSVRITYGTTDTNAVSFAVDGGAPVRADETSGARDVGPIPCDGRPHVVTLIAESNGLRATRDATVSVS